jgi:hypothetical protein
LWGRAHRLCEFLETRDGYRYRVVHPGVQSTAAGPDFRGAVLEDTNGQRVVGDVELHIAARDWYSHGHHADANYNGVVLHVVINGSSGRETIQQSGTVTPVVEFPLPLAEPVELSHQPELSISRISSMSLEDTAEMLDSLGDQRFMARSLGFSLEMTTSGNTDQILYSSLMQALGYKTNQKPFQLLANLVPYQTFRRYRDDPSETRVAAIESMLVSASGFLSELEPGPRKSQMERLARKSKRWRKLKLDEWKLFRVRPNNRPVHRISGFARVLAKSTIVGLAMMFKTAILQQEIARLQNLLEERPYIGLDRAQEMVVNVVLPFLHSLGEFGDDRQLMTLCVDGYTSMKPLASYGSITRFAESIDIPTDPKFIKTARRQQGLLHLQKHFAVHVEKFDVRSQGD